MNRGFLLNGRKLKTRRMNFKSGAVANEQRCVLIGSVLVSSLHKHFVQRHLARLSLHRETNNFIYPGPDVNVFFTE